MEYVYGYGRMEGHPTTEVTSSGPRQLANEVKAVSRPDAVMLACDPSVWEVEAGGSGGES